MQWVLFQIIFAVFVARFASQSLAAIYDLFKNNKTIFHSTLWFSIGYALGNFMSDWTTEQYRFSIDINFSSMVPLVFSGFCCLIILILKNNPNLTSNQTALLQQN